MKPHPPDIPVEKLHAQTVERICRSHPRLISVGRALEAVPRMRANLILHPGPPIGWERMSPVLRSSVVAALLYEGVADTEDEAQDMATSGGVVFAPAHDHLAVCPAAGVISPSMPVLIIKNETYNNFTYCTLFEGGGLVLRYGACKVDTLDRLNWVEKILAPVIRQAVAAAGGVDLRDIIAQALHMGDQGHYRTTAATALFIRTLAPYMVRTCPNREMLSQILFFLDGQPSFFRNLALAAVKSALNAAHGVPGSRIVTVMAHNGADFGLQVSGLDDEWFTVPIEPPDGLFMPGYSRLDAHPIIGDEAIIETGGWGAFALAGTPAAVPLLGSSVEGAMQITRDMYRITVGESTVLALPALDMRGAPTGIDVRRVADTGIPPWMHVEIIHREPGRGPIGVALWQPPLEPFIRAAQAFDRAVQNDG